MPGYLSRLSLRARLTAWYSVALLVALSVFAAVVVWQQSRIGVRRVDRELADEAATLTLVFRDELNETGNPAVAAAESVDTAGINGGATAVLDGQHAVLAARWNGLAADSATRERAARHGADPDTWTSGTWRLRTEPVVTPTGVFVLMVGAPLSEVLRERREAVEALWVGVPTAWLLAVAGGWWLATIGLRPITRMAAQASTLDPNGSAGLGESDREDELGQLALAFNGLLGRLRDALLTQRRFMADASHELRTPLSVTQSAADISLARDHRNEAEYRDALSVIAKQSRRMGHLLDDMLVLARADAGGYPIRAVELYLGELVTECVRTVEVLAHVRSVRIEVLTSPAEDETVVADEDLLRRLILNILQNAIRHSPPDARVRMFTEKTADLWSIRVSDQGTGIPANDREKVFQRFVRLDPSRTDGGAGLGLPIARWIAEAHGGSLVIETSSSDGTTVLIELPATGPPTNA